jgi:hypothetical protein
VNVAVLEARDVAGGNRKLPLVGEQKRAFPFQQIPNLLG